MEQILPLSIEVKLLDLFNKTNLDIFNLKTLAKKLDYADSSKNFITLKNYLIEHEVMTPVNNIENSDSREKFYKINYKKLYEFILNYSVIFNKSVYCVITKHPDIQLWVKFKGIEA